MQRRAFHRALALAPTLALVGCAAPPPPASRWVPLAPLPVGVAKFGVAAFGVALIVVGGYDTLKTTWLYDGANDRWVGGPPLPRGSDNVAVLAAGDRIYAIGGEAGPMLQVFDPRTGAWSAGPRLPGVRFASAAVALDGRLHLIGGWNADNKASASFASQAVFDIVTGSWRSDAAPLAIARNAAVAGVVGGRIVVAGGRAPGIRARDQQPLASVEIYDPAADRWSAGPPLPAARASAAAAVLNGRLYVFGGELAGGAVSDGVLRFDGQRWEELPPMPMPMHGLGAVAHGDSIYVIGGFTAPSDAVGSESRLAWRYVPPSPAATGS